MTRDIAFLENLNAKLMRELDAANALEKELRKKIERLEFELRTERQVNEDMARQLGVWD